MCPGLRGLASLAAALSDQTDRSLVEADEKLGSGQKPGLGDHAVGEITTSSQHLQATLGGVPIAGHFRNDKERPNRALAVIVNSVLIAAK